MGISNKIKRIGLGSMMAISMVAIGGAALAQPAPKTPKTAAQAGLQAADAAAKAGKTNEQIQAAYDAAVAEAELTPYQAADKALSAAKAAGLNPAQAEAAATAAKAAAVAAGYPLPPGEAVPPALLPKAVLKKLP
jgi:hypothetical protein